MLQSSFKKKLLKRKRRWNLKKRKGGKNTLKLGFMEGNNKYLKDDQ